MPRQARMVVPGVPHHVTQRGNNHQDVFFMDDDRRAYLSMLRDAAARWGLKVQGYCLMTNHVHIVATPQAEDSLAKAIGRTHFLYTQYVNRLHGRSGHLWQNRFYSCALDERHFWAALRYVERNPVRARLVRKARQYTWSSAAAHTGRPDPSVLLDLSEWFRKTSAPDWETTLADTSDADELARIRIYTHTGRPLGGDSFLSKIEFLLKRRVRALPEGRQKGWRKSPTN